MNDLASLIRSKLIMKALKRQGPVTQRCSAKTCSKKFLDKVSGLETRNFWEQLFKEHLRWLLLKNDHNIYPVFLFPNFQQIFG